MTELVFICIYKTCVQTPFTWLYEGFNVSSVFHSILADLQFHIIFIILDRLQTDGQIYNAICYRVYVVSITCVTCFLLRELVTKKSNDGSPNVAVYFLYGESYSLRNTFTTQLIALAVDVALSTYLFVLSFRYLQTMIFTLKIRCRCQFKDRQLTLH